MKNLRAYISKNYRNATSVLATIDRLGLFNILEKSIEKLDKCLNGNVQVQVPAIASNILTNVNLKIEQLESDEKKVELQACLVDVFKNYVPIVQQLTNGDEAMDQIKESLKNACDVNGYDYNELVTMLGLKAAGSVQRRRSGFCYYQWNGSTIQLDFLLDEIKPWIRSKREFGKLFDAHHRLDYVEIKPKHSNKLFLLIDLLYKHERKPLRPKGTSGRFMPLVRYCTDNELNFVYQIAPNKLNEALKRNGPWYTKEKGNLQMLIENILNK